MADGARRDQEVDVIRVAVLGSTGMLGHVVARELERDTRFEVKRFCRNPQTGEGFIDATSKGDVKGMFGTDYVINCVGLIKQLTTVDRRDWFVVNSIFPWALASQCQREGSKLIQISTDCVYAGTTGQYTEKDPHDAKDDYGLSKSLGEPRDAMVLRTSVIGHELRGRLSLLEWAISKRGQTVDGYVNHVWNGLTSIEYANVCKKIMVHNLFETGVHHVFSDVVTKHRLLSMFNIAYKLDLDVKETHASVSCDRTLKTIKGLNASLEIPSIDEMIKTMSSTTA